MSIKAPSLGHRIAHKISSGYIFFTSSLAPCEDDPVLWPFPEDSQLPQSAILLFWPPDEVITIESTAYEQRYAICVNNHKRRIKLAQHYRQGAHFVASNFEGQIFFMLGKKFVTTVSHSDVIILPPS